MCTSSFPLRCVSTIATMSGFSSYMNYIILYFFAVIPFTLIWIIFMLFPLCVSVYGRVIFMYSSRDVYLIVFRSSIISLALIYLLSSSSASSPATHYLILSICSLVFGAPNLISAYCHISG